MRASAKDFEGALNRKGFFLDRRTDDKIYYFYYQGLKTHIHTKVSMGKSEDLRDKLLGNIKRQMNFDSTAQLLQFIDCSLDEGAYIAHLKAKQVIT
jgi:hypothetical protein